MNTKILKNINFYLKAPFSIKIKLHIPIFEIDFITYDIEGGKNHSIC